MSTESRVFKTVSARAQRLLNREEGYDVEFKQSLAGLENDDLVAFANSEVGGTVLIGVKESPGRRGRQRGHIVGCMVGDKEKVGIVSRAEGCIPPVNLEIFVENASRNPFFRIEIPPGRNRPYCTPGGTYKTRGDGRNLPLIPSRLLEMFVESHSHDFLQRFQAATSDLELRLKDVSFAVGDVVQMISYVQDGVEESQSAAETAGGIADEALEMANDLRSSTDLLHDKLDALLAHLNITNPELLRHQAFVANLEEIFNVKTNNDESKGRKRKAA